MIPRDEVRWGKGAEDFRGDGYILHLNCEDSFTVVCLRQNLSTYTL